MVKNQFTKIFLLSLLVGLFPSSYAQAQTLLFQTSFTTAQGWTTDRVQYPAGPGFCNDSPICSNRIQPEIGNGGGWTTQNGNADSVTTAANYSGGAGGRGFRHWRGEGSGNNAGGIQINLPSPQSEIWFRWYMRYSTPNVQWNSLQQTKDLYINAGGGPGMSFTLGVHNGTNPGTFGVGVVQPKSQNLFSSPGWSVIGDGNWHALEFHVKTTSPAVAEYWVDGVLSQRHTTNPFDGQPLTFNNSPVSFILVGSNHCCTAAGSPDFYNDYDDFAISTTGYIGPISGGSNPPPPPGGTPVPGDINLDHIVNSIDYSLLNSDWFTSATRSDLNTDGIVNSLDYSILNSNWFKTW
jgi:hypothetical protein